MHLCEVLQTPERMRFQKKIAISLYTPKQCVLCIRLYIMLNVPPSKLGFVLLKFCIYNTHRHHIGDYTYSLLIFSTTTIWYDLPDGTYCWGMSY